MTQILCFSVSFGPFISNEIVSFFCITDLLICQYVIILKCPRKKTADLYRRIKVQILLPFWCFYFEGLLQMLKKWFITKSPYSKFCNYLTYIYEASLLSKMLLWFVLNMTDRTHAWFNIGDIFDILNWLCIWCLFSGTQCPWEFHFGRWLNETSQARNFKILNYC